MEPQPVRRAAVAGAWYPGSPSALAQEVDRYCGRVAVRVGGEIAALIVPHAGLPYSGPVAAHAYAQLGGRAYDAVVVIGPSHYVSFAGAAVVRRGSFETPLGPIPIAADVADALMAAMPLACDRPDAHAREHSLEMQLPFLQRQLPGVPIVPVVMGDPSPATRAALGAACARVLEGRRILLVASSDLSHYHDAARAAALDGLVVDAIGRFDLDAFERAVDARHEHACGAGAIAAVMRAARARGARAARVLCYQDSGDVSGDKSAVVGYVAAALGTF